MPSFDLADALAAAFAEHGVPSIRAESRIWLRDHGCAVELFLTEYDGGASNVTCRLDVSTTLADGHTVLESFAGVGAAIAEAQRDAFENFLHSSFHVLLRAFLIPRPDDHVSIDEWEVAGKKYVATVGNVVGRGTPPGGVVPISWFATLEQAIKSAADLDDVTWVRFYYGHMHSRAMAVEVLRNNEPWPEVAATMAALQWPSSEPFYSVRLFLVLQHAV